MWEGFLGYRVSEGGWVENMVIILYLTDMVLEGLGVEFNGG